MTDITKRGHARTNYEPYEFVEAMSKAETLEREAEIRRTFRNLDDGRFYDFLDEAHNVLAKSHLTRRDHFTDHYSPRLIEWIRAFGHVEELNTFPDL